MLAGAWRRRRGHGHDGPGDTFFQGGKLHKVTGFAARRGYDLASGVGTVDARWFVPELGVMARHPHWSWQRIAAVTGGLG